MDRMKYTHSRIWLESLLLFFGDLASFGITYALTAILRTMLLGLPISFIHDTPSAFTLQLIFTFSEIVIIGRGLLPGWKRSSVVEMKQIFESITIAYVIMSVFIFIMRNSVNFSRLAFLLSWFILIVLFPVIRFLMRLFISKFPWWGEPVVVVGTKDRILEVANQFLRCPRIGIRPVIGMALDQPSNGNDILPIMLWSEDAQGQLKKGGIQTCVLAIASNDLLRQYPDVYHQLQIGFNKTIFILHDEMFSFMMANTMDIAGVPAISSRQSLFNPITLLFKNLVEYLIVLIILIPTLLLGLFIALLIRIDSPGPVLFTQPRTGEKGKIIRVFKFRTMVQNGEEILKELLKDPKLLAEYEQFHKLENDKRITRVGKVLRKLSLDELPQMINVLRGEMSLVGPRPYLQEEIAQMGDAANIILHVSPGMTGWWQVNGRNKNTFEERIKLEMYYVSNWSFWLDIFIIIKTFWVILFLREGK